MTEYMTQYAERVRRLKCDAYAMNDWRALKIQIERRGGKWIADNGMIFELRDGVIYQYLSDRKEGVANIVIMAVDAMPPWGAELHIDLQGTPPERRKALLTELEQTAAQRRGVESQVVVIVKGDWLSKISKARWGTIDWKLHLKPTQMTLDSRRSRGKGWNPDLIYPGDTFEVI